MTCAAIGASATEAGAAAIGGADIERDAGDLDRGRNRGVTPAGPDPEEAGRDREGRRIGGHYRFNAWPCPAE